MQRKISTAHRKDFAQQIPAPRSPGSSDLIQHRSALVHAAWAGWQYETPAEEDTIPLFDHAREVQDMAARSDRVIAEFRVESASEAATRVNEAVALAELEAYAEQTRGVLVTRHDFDLFSVALSEMVPFGVTIEQDSARRPRCSGGLDPAPRPAIS